MDTDPAFIETTKQTVIRVGGVDFGAQVWSLEVWGACEAVTSPDINVRREGLERLLTLDVVRKSPLVAYLLASRIVEPDLALRTRVVNVLAEIFSRDQDEAPVSNQVKQHLNSYLSQMRTRPIFALLQVAEMDSGCEDRVALLLNNCPHGAGRLTEILTNRQFSLSIRKMAARIIGLVGYLEALPTLEKLATRLEARSLNNGNEYENNVGDDELTLLAPVLEALERLRAP